MLIVFLRGLSHPVAPVATAAILFSLNSEMRLEREDCRRYGWILTGFARNIYQAILMMDVESFPNRVVELKTTIETSRHRLVSRYCDPASGVVLSLSEKKERQLPAELAAHLRRHPHDEPDQVDLVLQTETRQLRPVISFLRKYVQVVDGEMPIETVTERIETIINSEIPIKLM